MLILPNLIQKYFANLLKLKQFKFPFFGLVYTFFDRGKFFLDLHFLIRMNVFLFFIFSDALQLLFHFFNRVIDNLILLKQLLVYFE